MTRRRGSGRFSAEIERDYEAGEDIVREGDAGAQMYIIQSGSAVALKRIDGRDVELVRLAKGEFFGEMSMLDGLPRSATVRAVEPTKVLVIEQGGFLLKVRRDPTLAFELMLQLSGRVRRLTDQLATAMTSDAQSPGTAKLLVAHSEFEHTKSRA